MHRSVRDARRFAAAPGHAPPAGRRCASARSDAMTRTKTDRAGPNLTRMVRALCKVHTATRGRRRGAGAAEKHFAMNESRESARPGRRPGRGCRRRTRLARYLL
jgi:hypothetical protein